MTSTEIATPILVVGVNRSGTKWLSNEIATHPDVTAVQHEWHGGIVESNCLTEFGRSFDLGSESVYREFLDFWQRTHFFELAGGNVDWFATLDPRPPDTVTVFRRLMDRLAQQRGNRFWIQKIAPADAEAVLSVLSDARVVVITRSDLDTVRSKIRLDAKRGIKLGSLRAGMSQGVQSRQLQRIAERPEVLTVQYEHLVADRDRLMAEVFRFFEIEPSETASSFRPNTSFKRGERREPVSGFTELNIKLATSLCRVLPLPVLLSLQKAMTRGRPQIIQGTLAHTEAADSPDA